MEEHVNSVAPSQPAVPRPWPDHRWLLLLLLLIGGLRAWQVTHTQVLARDSIGFICMAWDLEHQSPVEVLRDAEYHPAYPALILLASLPLRLAGLAPVSLALQTSAQLVSVAASLLLILPMFYLGKALFNGRVAFWACLLFQFLPACGRVLGDGLNEATYLFFAVNALYLAWRGLRSRSPWWFALCGVSGGLAYLTRPEGALTVMAAGGVLLVAQVVREWRRPWRNWLVCGGSLAVSAVLIGTPLLLLSGRVILKPSGRVFETSENVTPILPQNFPGVRTPISGNTGPGAPLWAVWWADEQKKWPILDWRWGLHAVGYEGLKGFHYVLWLPALFGLVWFWRQTVREPGAWVILLVCLVLFLLLWRLASVMGYISDRHMLLLVLCSCWWAVAGVEAAAGVLARLSGGRLARWCRRSPEALGRIGAGLLVAAAVGSAVPKLLEPLHSDRSGFREVGLWLAERLGPDDAILDPYRWPGYYAGEDFRPKVPLNEARTRYVVFEESDNPHGHLGLHEQARILRKWGTEVHSWSGQRGKRNVKIIVFTLPSPKPPGPRRG